ncbi:hypothetical protein HOO65_030422 [Ceratocystis lukuohia]|uniref:Uncharacterized protein n=1 Tax=Ceratocystis lukuohia TaxID=2019550 RepID=A0ABR4MKZ9_9PEZI
MRFYSFLSLGLLILPFGSCRPGPAQDLQPTNAAGIETTQARTLHKSTDTSDPNYLKDHGYSLWDFGGGKYVVLSRSCTRRAGLQPVLQISIDDEQKVATIRDNKLDLELFREDRLRLHQIFQALCYKHKTPFREMKRVVMDITDPTTHLDVKRYRKTNGLGFEDEIKVTPNQPGWEAFSSAIYYRQATQMVPGAEVDEILIKEQRRDSRNFEYAAVIAEVMTISFKQRGLNDEDVLVDPTGTNDAELAAEGDPNAAWEVANKGEAELEESASGKYPDPTLSSKSIQESS